MRNIIVILLIILGGCSRDGIPSRPDSLGRETVPVNLIKPEIFSLENGLTIYYLPDLRVPIVRGQLLVKGGSLFEPSTMVGLAHATGSLLREGSVRGIKPSDFDRRLGNLGASIESGFASEYGEVSFHCLSEDFTEVFELFRRVVREPAFDQGRLDTWKKLTLDAIRKRREDPSTMAEMTFAQVLFGEGSPYSRAAEPSTIQRITVDEMRKFYQNYVRPTGSILVITGAIDRNGVEAAVREQFGSWARNDLPILEYPEVSEVLRPGIYLLQRDFDQAEILLGHLGPPRFPPDLFAMVLFNRVYSYPAHGSVLFGEIRARRGLAYSVGGGLRPDRERGVFEIELGTRNEQAVNALESVLKVIEASQVELPPEDLFVEAKLAVRNGHIFKFQSAAGIVDRAAELALLGYPDDFDEAFLTNIPLINREDVRQVAKRWIDPKEFAVVIVGNITPDLLQDRFQGRFAVHQVEFDTKPLIH